MRSNSHHAAKDAEYYACTCRDNRQPELEPTSKVGAINVPKLPAALLSFAISAAHGWGCSVMNDRAKAEPCSDCLQPAQ